MKRILIIEDDTFMARAVNLILGKQGYNITIAQNGKEAIGHMEGGDFDLIITDLMLPFASGLELLSRLKRNQLKKGTPVMILSAITNEKTVLDGFDLGADDYLKKPFAPSELVSRVNRLVQQVQNVY
ncbi:MAG TPA: response regulator transcription factor [Chitinophaga sp.]|uniref:response regulator transcription factor n=1 Tax=Chitinophaga sp. TaxID=1869181 RepID=UPI002CD2C569|nr:response regulator transcription factor [Chitinophaga sp.]HVI45748.1 response regulator transcription factor [Chitinophaga sp.]